MFAVLETEKSETLLVKALIIVFIIRLLFSIWLPLTGDEAYFILWGKNPDYGYYDHTPFVGWLLAAFLTISDTVWWLRLPAVLLPVIIAYGIYHILKKRQPQVAFWVALTFLVAPVNIINVLITTDTPLIFFSFVSVWFFYCALHENNKQQKIKFLLAGLFLGLAFISKYFAVFLGFSYGLYILFFYRNKKGFAGLGLILLMVLPFVLLNLLWNYNHCWNNILFNLINRTESVNYSLSNLYKYAGILLYLFSPVLIYYLVKNRKKYSQISREKCNHVYLWMTIIPLILFLLLLLRKEIGLHWVLSFYPFIFVASASLLSTQQWRVTFYFMLVFSLIHLVIISTVLLFPVKTFISDKTKQQNFAFGRYPDKFLNELKQYEDDYTFSTVSYAMAAIASYHSNKRFIVFSEGSFHARQDDLLTDYKELNGKNILLLKRSTNYLDVYKNYFVTSERKSISVDGIRFELLLGRGFKYELYRKEILTAVNKDYYNIPDWLPAGKCNFKDKYNLN